MKKTREPLLHKHITDQIIVEGNNGGDTLEIFKGSSHDNNVVHLTVGHGCVYYIDMEIPVEILTSILIAAIEEGKLTNPDMLPWNKKLNKQLISQMENR